MHGWAHHPVATRPSASHLRNLSGSSRNSQSSSNISTLESTRSVQKSPSVPSLTSKMAAAAVAASAFPLPHNSIQRLSSYSAGSEEMSTIPDPRSRAMSPSSSNGPPSPVPHPDLSNEVATLSNKLINAINHQTNLDDTLSATRHELEMAREKIKSLEEDATKQKELVDNGSLVKRSTLQQERSKLMTTLVEERRQKATVEKEKKDIEMELENLTAALFEEANKMVISSREESCKEYDALQKKNDQLKAQLADMEGLLRSHQEQLAELKHVMEQMSTEQRDDQTDATAPSTPGIGVARFDGRDDTKRASGAFPRSDMLGSEDIPPSYPTSFTHLLHPVLRTDLSAYDDFSLLLHMSRNHNTGSRVNSGSYGGLGIGLGLGAYASGMTPSTSSTTSTAGGMPYTSGQMNTLPSSSSMPGTFGGSPTAPTTPAHAASHGFNNGQNSNPLPPLKETKFYKRALAEDIEPTLRLDTAPGLSWLARRSVLTAMCEGSLVVEPIPASTSKTIFKAALSYPCSLCGEVRKDKEHARTHRFRTNESDGAQRYPLCSYCLGRVRSSCELLGFLRILREGHWRADSEESERAAWEESVRLREQMFWSRMGGGVVPGPVGSNSSSGGPARSLGVGGRDVTGESVAGRPKAFTPRNSEEKRLREVELEKLSEEAERTGEIQPKDVTPNKKSQEIAVLEAEGAATESNRRIMPKREKETAEGLWQQSQEDAIAPLETQTSDIGEEILKTSANKGAGAVDIEEAITSTDISREADLDTTRNEDTSEPTLQNQSSQDAEHARQEAEQSTLPKNESEPLSSPKLERRDIRRALRDSTMSLASQTSDSGENEARLSLTIPGAFE